MSLWKQTWIQIHLDPLLLLWASSVWDRGVTWRVVVVVVVVVVTAVDLCWALGWTLACDHHTEMVHVAAGAGAAVLHVVVAGAAAAAGAVAGAVAGGVVADIVGTAGAVAAVAVAAVAAVVVAAAASAAAGTPDTVAADPLMARSRTRPKHKKEKDTNEITQTNKTRTSLSP